MREAIRENWKTAAAGLAIIFVGIGFLMRQITFDQFLAAFVFLTGGGLMLAGDANGKKKPTTSKSDGEV